MQLPNLPELLDGPAQPSCLGVGASEPQHALGVRLAPVGTDVLGELSDRPLSPDVVKLLYVELKRPTVPMCDQESKERMVNA